MLRLMSASAGGSVIAKKSCCCCLFVSLVFFNVKASRCFSFQQQCVCVSNSACHLNYPTRKLYEFSKITLSLKVNFVINYDNSYLSTTTTTTAKQTNKRNVDVCRFGHTLRTGKMCRKVNEGERERSNIC